LQQTCLLHMVCIQLLLLLLRLSLQDNQYTFLILQLRICLLHTLYIQLRRLLLTRLLRTEDMFCPSFNNLLRNL
jgi:hypothetical protein